MRHAITDSRDKNCNQRQETGPMTILNALMPVFLVILAGVALKRVRVLTPEQWQGFETLTYYIFFPALLIYTLANADLEKAPIGPVALILFGVTVFNMLLTWALRPALVDGSRADDRAFTSFFQGASRWNSFAALAIAASIAGQTGATLIAVAFVAMIPVLNLFCVIVLTLYAGNGRPNLADVGLELARNPLIVSIAIGVGLYLLPFRIPPAILDSFHIIGVSGLGAALVLVGVGLKLRSLRTPNRFVLASIFFKLVFVPGLGLLAAHLMGLDLVARQSIVIALGVPTATVAYVLARKLGGDAELMATILTMQTFLSFLTLPVWLWIAGLI